MTDKYTLEQYREAADRNMRAIRQLMKARDEARREEREAKRRERQAGF